MPRYHSIVLNLPGKDIGAIVVEHPSPTRLFGNRTGGGETDRNPRVQQQALHKLAAACLPRRPEALASENGAAQKIVSDF